MKKSLVFVGALAAAVLFASCASTAKTEKKETAKAAEPVAAVEKSEVVCGAWNAAKTAYSLDLSKIQPNDSTVVTNADGTATVTFGSNYQSVVFPLPFDDPDFMGKMTKCTITVNSEYEGQRKFAWKLSNDIRFAWEKGAGILGQGDHCVGFMFRDYDDPWTSDGIVELYFNGDDTSFGKFTDKMYKGLKGLAWCNNQTKFPFTFTVKSVVFTAE